MTPDATTSSNPAKPAPTNGAPNPPTDSSSKAYQPAAVQPRISALWEASGAFHANPANVLNGSKKPFCILIPPPNVTGALHLGHALNNTLQDILTRAHRMMGFETLWMPGTDHAGIATQAVVEKRLRKEGRLKGPLKSAFTREQFIAQVQQWKDEYEATITGQLKAMGCSCDYGRQRFTMDDICARAVREAFFRLFKDGLIYRGKRLVNWDPALQTAVADDECYEEEVDTSFWYLRYPLVHSALGTPTLRGGSGESHEPAAERRGTQSQDQPVTWNELARRGYPGADQHPGEQPAWVTVATTRPETYLGDTAVAINPHDPRAKSLRGLHVELPLVGRIIPIVEDSYVVLPEHLARNEEEKNDPKAKFATGFLKVTPAHDQNDAELGQRHNLPAINMMSPDGKVSDKHGWTDVGDAHLFVGLSMADARKKVVAEFEARGLLEATKPYRQSKTFSDRSKAVIEPYLSDQWYVRVTDDRLSGAANRALVPDQRTGSPHGLSEKHPRNPAGSPANAGAPGESTIVSTGARTISAGATIVWAGAKTIPAGATIGSTEPTTDSVGARVGSAGPRVGSPEPTTGSGGPKTLSGGSIGRASENPAGDNSAGDGSMRFYPARYAKTYEQWHDNIRDWCISRQLWWGHRIPVWTRPDWDRREAKEDWKAFGRQCSKWTGEDRICMRNASIDRAHHQQPDPEVADWSAFWICVRDENDREVIAELERRGFVRDPDVLDTWFSSALWPLSTMGWPGSSEYIIHLLDPADDAGPDGIAPREKAIAAICSYLRAESVDKDTSIEVESQPGFDFVWLRVVAGSDRAMQVVRKLAPVKYTKEESEARYRYHLEGLPEGDKLAAARYWIEGGKEGTDLLWAFNPTTVLSTAREIITLWVSRMVMMNRYLLAGAEAAEGHSAIGIRHSAEPGAVVPNAECRMPNPGPVPFHNVFIHAVVQDGEGRKMSKSLGNGVDPLDIIETHGADAMRFTLAQMATNTQDVRMPVKRDAKTGKNSSDKFDAGRNFCNKLWNASRFAISILQKGALSASSGSDSATLPLRHSATSPLSLTDRWLLSRLARAIRACETALANYEFADYGQALYQLLWWDFCDWYLEAIKPTVDANPQQRAILRTALDTIIRLLHPVAPFITEEIFRKLQSEVDGIKEENLSLLCTSAWPEAADFAIDDAAEKQFEELQTLINTIRNIRSEHQVLPKRRITLHCSDAAAKRIAAAAPGLVENLAGLEAISTAKPPASHVTFRAAVGAGEDMFLSNLADEGKAIDAGAEKDRLTKTLADLKKSEAALAARLNNPGYADKAPAKLVEESKAQLAKIRAEIAATESKLKGL